MMASAAKEVAKELLPLVRVYNDGSVERLRGSPCVPPSQDQDPETGISSKDITISHDPNISARLYIPKPTKSHHKFPILVYFHGGGFCIESAFSFLDHRYMNSLVSRAQVLAVSVEYRLAPEHPLPAAYEDCWNALKWVASHSVEKEFGYGHKEPWILDHGDFGRVFIGGDSAGGNIVHNIAMRAGAESLDGQVKFLGAFLTHPYFWGSKPVGNEPSENHENALAWRVWDFVYPSAPGGIDNPMVNPAGPGAASLAGLGCSRMLVCVAGKDKLRDRGVWYYNLVKESGWRGQVELFEVKGEDHAFHILHPESENFQDMINCLASFLNN